MEIHIHPAKKLSEIQSEFHKLFPYLKIEFFSKKHEKGGATPYSTRLDPKLTVAEAGNFDGEKDIKITGHTKAGRLENDFQELLGIGVQILRRSGAAWILTTLTDDWTLAHQNDEGKRDTLAIAADVGEIEEFDPQVDG